MDRWDGRGVSMVARELGHTHPLPEGPLRVLDGLDFAIPGGHGSRTWTRGDLTLGLIGGLMISA